MYSIGLAMALLYIASLTCFLLAAQYDHLFKWFMGMCALFFIVASGTLLVMMRIRMEKQDF